jgi:hypothetical protein
VAALTAEQAAALTADQVAALATAGLLADLADAAEAALSVDSLDNLTVAQVAALPASVIANLAPDTLASPERCSSGCSDGRAGCGTYR